LLRERERGEVGMQKGKTEFEAQQPLEFKDRLTARERIPVLSETYLTI